MKTFPGHKAKELYGHDVLEIMAAEIIVGLKKVATAKPIQFEEGELLSLMGPLMTSIDYSMASLCHELEHMPRKIRRSIKGQTCHMALSINDPKFWGLSYTHKAGKMFGMFIHLRVSLKGEHQPFDPGPLPKHAARLHLPPLVNPAQPGDTVH